MLDLGCLPQRPGDQRLVRRSVDDELAGDLQADLAQVDAVGDHLARPRQAAIEQLGDRAPAGPAGAKLECPDHLRRPLGIRLERTVLRSIARRHPVADRHHVRRPDPALDGRALRRRDLASVALALHLADRQEHVAHQTPLRGAGVEVLRDRDHLAARGLDPADHPQRLEDRHPRQAIERVDDQPRRCARLDPLERRLEDRPAHLPARDVELGLEHLDLDPALGGVGLDHVGLEVGRDQRVGTIADSRNASVAEQGHPCADYPLNLGSRLDAARRRSGGDPYVQDRVRGEVDVREQCLTSARAAPWSSSVIP
jgi:hypothetical protein